MLKNMNKIPYKIAVIAAHPDDEALGAGGTLLKFKEMGHEVHLLFMTNGISSRTLITKNLKIRQKESEEAINFLSPSSYKSLDFPDNKLDTVPLLDITKEIEKFLKNVKPDMLLTHFSHDLNIDHQITYQSSITACRPGSETFVKKVLSFEIPSSTDWNLGSQRFSPNYFVDISNYIDKKISYLKYYKSEMREYPHARSFENIYALSQVRGSEVSVKNAEGFILLRNLKNEF